MQEINVSRAGDSVHAGDKALKRETPAQRGRVNRYAKTCAKMLMVLNQLFESRKGTLHSLMESDFFLSCHLNLLHNVFESMNVDFSIFVEMHQGTSAFS